MSAKKIKKSVAVQWHFPLEKKNLIIIGIGIAVVIFGYILMSFGITETPAAVNGTWNNVFSVSIAPLLLIIGYCVIIPYGIFRTFSSTDKTAE
jgi:hypothetical protein